MPSHAEWDDLRELEDAGMVELAGLYHPVAATWRITDRGKRWLASIGCCAGGDVISFNQRTGWERGLPLNAPVARWRPDQITFGARCWLWDTTC